MAFIIAHTVPGCDNNSVNLLVVYVNYTLYNRKTTHTVTENSVIVCSVVP